MARRSDHTREELKDLILKASSKIVETEGFAALTARRIAQEIGYAPGTIYNLFSSMDDLYLNVSVGTLERLRSLLASPECNNPKKSPVQNIKKMAQLYRDFARSYRPHWLMLFTHTMAEGQDAPAWFYEKIDCLFEPLEGLLESFYTPNEARERKMAARVLWSSVHGLCFLEETGKMPLISNSETAPDMAGYLIDNFISGIRAGRS